MYGHPSHRSPAAGGGSGRGGAVPQPQALPPSPYHFIHNVNSCIQNPTFQANLGFPYIQNPNLPVQNHSFPFTNPSFSAQSANFTGFRPQPPKRNKEVLDRADGAVVKARRDLIAAGESVSAWKVSQSALLALQVDSWESLGFQMQEVPCLHSLIVMEGKVMHYFFIFYLVA